MVTTVTRPKKFQFPLPKKFGPALPTAAKDPEQRRIPLLVRRELDALRDPAYASEATASVRAGFQQRSKWFGGLSSERKLDALHAGTTFAVSSIHVKTPMAEHVAASYIRDYPSLDDRIRIGVEGTEQAFKSYMQEHNKAAPSTLLSTGVVRPRGGTGFMYPTKAVSVHQNAVILRDWPDIASKPDVEARLILAGFHSDSPVRTTKKGAKVYGLAGLGVPKSGFSLQMVGKGSGMATIDSQNAQALGFSPIYGQLPDAHSVRVTTGIEGMVQKHTGIEPGIATWTAWLRGVLGVKTAGHKPITDAMGVQ